MAKYLRTPNYPGVATWVDAEDAVPNGDINYGGYMVVAEGTAYPLTEDKHEKGARGTHAQQLFDAYDTHYSRCFAEVSVIDTDGNVTKTRDLNFASRATILAYANANIANSGGFFTETMRIRFYDKVDPSIKPVRHIRGFNASMGRVRNPVPWNTHVGDNNARQMLISMWNNTIGAFPVNKSNAAWDTTGDPWGVFWYKNGVNRSYGLEYGFPWNAASIRPGGPKMVSGGGFLDEAGVWAPVGGATWGVTSPDGLQAYSDGGKLREQGVALLEGFSILIGVPMTNGAGGSAMYLIPCGMDTFDFSWYDTSLYRLEAVGQAAPNKGPALRACTPTLAGWPGGDLIGHVGLDQFGEAASAYSKRRKRRVQDFVPPGSVRFQLRDLTTNEVSQLSAHEIYFKPRARYLQYQAFVRLSGR